MEFSIKITDKSAGDFLQKLREEMPAITRMCRENICLEIVKRSQSKYLTGGNPLHVRTGTLRSGMWYKLDSAGLGKDEVGDRVKYAKVHESAEIKDRTILPKGQKTVAGRTILTGGKVTTKFSVERVNGKLKAMDVTSVSAIRMKKIKGYTTKGKLFIPLNARARKGYKKGMKWGIDFVMADKVIMPHRPFILPAIDDILKTNKGQDIIDKVLKREIERLQNAS